MSAVYQQDMNFHEICGKG